MKKMGFSDGWMHFWAAFSNPLPAVAGFAVALLVWMVVGDVLMAVIKAAWRALCSQW